MPKYIEIHDVNDIGNIVRDFRKNMNLTQKETAGLCNVGTRFISELENGKKTLEVSKVLHVIHNLGLVILFSNKEVKK